MTGSTSLRLRVECTECEFSETLVRKKDGWTAGGVAAHASRTGHRLRSVPLDGRDHSE